MPSEQKEPQLNERALHLFKVLVERYIREGEPVGSRTLSRDSMLNLSPATVRNVMADLEECGLLRSPHTSAGRVPTNQGFRFFVDTLLRVEPLERAQVAMLEEHLNRDQNRGALMESASALLSNITHLAGVVMLPRQEHVTLRQVEFLSLSDDQVLVILVVNEREVQNRIIRTGRKYSQAELQQAANYLNSLCAGRDLMTVRNEILAELRTTRESMNAIMQAAVEMAEKALEREADVEEMVVAGQTNLMDSAELADMEKLRRLFEAFSEKRELLYLLDHSLNARGVQIFIGEESGFNVLDECSVVTASYGSDDEVLGVLGVIGPTRMPYERVIPVVDITARLLTAALNRQH
ncbi:MAG: heat-inducible transcriptional repressor HrcA [Gammaproteobacteria bacterium]|nr:heat-inducible transcriptional repressor HrcA [Gammaproteobacteria bacterium]NIM73932.1 heat-inducible transcriptional repressor HrcA [Gammaproteobacteria bacterium]NIN38120.1 heat-inducible transcriptional repressor HrcA [Gammaproteobacteria bacterium]NIO25713.1 heat-inducible transcriptional repressor HrcA [Gammaproteobacteria bacterium]NIO66347.1 heat-inducible transcriptional repressor HrcA [Gammaproteobacteria bacterium]